VGNEYPFPFSNNIPIAEEAVIVTPLHEVSTTSEKINK
jgi:hypothetical protein